MNEILIILGTLGGVFTAVMTVFSAINSRKPRKITLLSTFLSGLIALLGLAAMVFLGGMWVAPYLGGPLFLAGILLGYIRGIGVKMRWENEQVIGKNSIFFLVLWGISLALTQLLGLFGSPLLASLGLIPAVFTTGLQVGFYGHIFLRRLIISKEKDRKGMRRLITIGGIVLLCAVIIFSFILSLSEIVYALDDPGLSSRIQHETNSFASDPVPSTNEVALFNTVTGPGASTGLLPSSGSLVINWDFAVQEEIDWDV